MHGAPLRIVVPGWSGNWSVKWLEVIEVRGDTPPLYYQSEYFVYGDRDDEQREMITTMGVRCVILEPRHDDPLTAGPQVVRGLAWSGRGRIERVEVSVDGGEHWRIPTWRSRASNGCGCAGRTAARLRPVATR